MKQYLITIIKKDREKDYDDFWNRGIEENISGEILHSDLLAFSVTIKAKSKQDAISIIKQQYPNLLIDEQSITCF